MILLKSFPFQNQKQHYMRYLIYSNLCIFDKRITQNLELELGNLYYYVKTDPDDIYRVYDNCTVDGCATHDRPDGRISPTLINNLHSHLFIFCFVF